VNGSLAGYLARRFALLALTLVLVPSLSFLMFTLIQGDDTAPLDLLDQLAAYLSRHPAAWGALAYPADPDRPGTPPVEARNPWRLEGGQRVWFLTLPHDVEGVAAKLRPVLRE